MTHEIKPELIVAHWSMVDSLCTEAFLYRRDEMAKVGELFWNLFSVISRDPRFEAVGWSRHHKGYMVYTDPVGVSYFGEAAAAAFLGMPMKSLTTTVTHQGEEIQHYKRAAVGALNQLFRFWDDWPSFHDWMRWETQKRRGVTNKTKNLDLGYPAKGPRDFPDTLKLINELYPQKD